MLLLITAKNIVRDRVWGPSLWSDFRCSALCGCDVAYSDKDAVLTGAKLLSGFLLEWRRRSIYVSNFYDHLFGQRPSAEQIIIPQSVGSSSAYAIPHGIAAGRQNSLHNHTKN